MVSAATFMSTPGVNVYQTDWLIEPHVKLLSMAWICAWAVSVECVKGSDVIVMPGGSSFAGGPAIVGERVPVGTADGPTVDDGVAVGANVAGELVVPQPAKTSPE